MGIVILEGSDCVGKTTFAETLAKVTGYEIVKGSSFEISELGGDGMYEYMAELLSRDNIIIDRFYLSNLIYAKLYDYPTMTEEQFDNISFVADQVALTVLVTSPIPSIKYRMENRGDDMIKVEEVDAIVGAYYKEIFDDFRPSQFLSFDTTLTSTVEMAELVSKIVS